MFFADVNIGQVNCSFALIVDKYISIDVLDAIVVNFNINPEEWAQKGQQLISGNEVIQRFSFIHENHKRSEEVNHDVIHDRVFIDCFEDRQFARAQLSEELRDECFGLSIIEECGVVFLVEDKLEGRVIDQLFNFVNQLLWFWTIDLET